MKKPILAIALITNMLLSGCDSDRLSQFGSFAAAGTAYVTTFQSFTTEVGSAVIAADSATLITARNQAGDQVVANAASFRKNVATDDATLRDYLSNLQKLNAHAALLGAYFTAITQITSGKASTATVTSLDSLVDSIDKFNPKIEQASFAGKNVKDYLGPVTTLIVAHFEVKALNDQLSKSAPVIDKALSLQEAAVAALTAQLKDSLTASLEVQESTTVLNPYVAAGSLPSSWASNRESFIREDVTLQSADSAQSAITSLHKAFTELVTNKQSTISFSSLMADIGKMAGYVSDAKSATP
jgi:hypothetical protein